MIPDSRADGEVSVRAAGGRAGAGVVDVCDQRVGRGSDHGLQVDAGVGQRRDGQSPLPAQPGGQPRAGEPRYCTKRSSKGFRDDARNHFSSG